MPDRLICHPHAAPHRYHVLEGERRQLQGHGTDVVLREDGKLADLAPTILEILQIPQPVEMTGKSMVVPTLVEFQHTRSPMRVGV